MNVSLSLRQLCLSAILWLAIADETVLLKVTVKTVELNRIGQKGKTST